MRVGIFARTFSRPSLEEVLDAVVGHGIHEAQFNMSVAGLPSMPEEIDPALADRVRGAAAERTVALTAVSWTKCARPTSRWSWTPPTSSTPKTPPAGSSARNGS